MLSYPETALAGYGALEIVATEKIESPKREVTEFNFTNFLMQNLEEAIDKKHNISKARNTFISHTNEESYL